LAQIILILHSTKPLENLVQHFNTVTWRWRHQNAVYRQRRTFKKSFSKGKTWHCKSIAERLREHKLESSL